MLSGSCRLEHSRSWLLPAPCAPEAGGLVAGGDALPFSAVTRAGSDRRGGLGKSTVR